MKRRSLNMAGCLFLVLALLALAACRERIPMPEDMVGTWVTPDPRYQDRYLQLTHHGVALGTGRNEAQRHTIEAVYSSRDDGKTLYTVVYRTGYGEDSLALFREDDAIVFRNQPDVRWSKGDLQR